VSCSALRVCVLLESGLEYSRIEWRCVESTAKCDVTTVPNQEPRTYSRFIHSSMPLIKRTQRRGADFNSTQETFVEGVECNQPQLGLRCVTAGAVLMKPYGGARRL
jgi:hypothetical protein